MLRELRTAAVMLLLLTLVTGVAYPLVVTAVARFVFPHAANGSVIEANGHASGSELIGQAFDRSEYFWGRPSATSWTSRSTMAGSPGAGLWPRS